MSLAVDNMRATLGMGPVNPTTIDNPPVGEDDDKPIRPPAKLEIITKPSVLDNEILKDNDLAQDYVFARNLTHTMIQLVGDQLAGAAIVAQETEHPRAYGVFNELAGTMRNIIQDLLALQKTFKEVKRDDPYVQAGMPPAPVAAVTQNIQNNVYNGTTADIIRVMEAHSPIDKILTLDIGDAEIEETGRDDRDEVTDVEPKDGNAG